MIFIFESKPTFARPRGFGLLFLLKFKCINQQCVYIQYLQDYHIHLSTVELFVIRTMIATQIT